MENINNEIQTQFNEYVEGEKESNGSDLLSPNGEAVLKNSFCCSGGWATNLPPQCGCYLFTNQQGEIIYIGKARNLKNRISSYWQKTPVSDYFRQQIWDFNIILTQNVKEALILEQNLIKKHQPRFNVLLKDSNYYPYLEITAEKNPRYKVVRKIDPQKKSSYFGPFPDGSKAREILQLLERLFPLAKCKDKSYYEKTRKQISQFFHGQTQEIKKKILDSLRKNIKDLAFEIAQKEKKILDNIDFFTSKQNVEFQQNNDYDFLGIHSEELPASAAVAGFLAFTNGERDLRRSKLYKLDGTDNDSDIARIKKAVTIHYQKFSAEKIPNLLVVDGGKEQVKAAQHVLKRLELPVLVIGLVKNEKHCTTKIITRELTELDFGSQERIRNFFANCQEEVHRYALNFHRKLHRQTGGDFFAEFLAMVGIESVVGFVENKNFFVDTSSKEII
ncbi:25126_t:CDS:2 [Cetraspora pellucida]|uniref:25126_t:CDS:1 n=1 Tax=Cetraspora pellucida TaxID=1433469 RepID=A0A9N9ABI5_9GLOM|nr:25126_t:CDS:2 [Cetraspora pellucida]